MKSGTWQVERDVILCEDNSVRGIWWWGTEVTTLASPQFCTYVFWSAWINLGLVFLTKDFHGFLHCPGEHRSVNPQLSTRVIIFCLVRHHVTSAVETSLYDLRFSQYSAGVTGANLTKSWFSSDYKPLNLNLNLNKLGLINKCWLFEEIHYWKLKQYYWNRL